MINKKDYSSVPEAVLNHYWEHLTGYKRKVNGVEITEKHWSLEDEATMKRLLTATTNNGKNVWKEISKAFPNSEEQIKLFNAAWIAKVNYDHYRFTKNNDGKKTTAKKLIKDIAKTANQLLSHLKKINDLGYRSVRYPDLNLNSPSLQVELHELFRKIDKFDVDRVSDEEFINKAIISNKANGKWEYLRGFISILHQSDFPLEKRGIAEKILAPLASAAIVEIDGGVSGKDIHDVFEIFR
ncbi:MAG: hypothetical protein H6937_09070 [Burkholderiales bacterium]|nr:hypothetical protein [Burkholderiales bacterium]